MSRIHPVPTESGQNGRQTPLPPFAPVQIRQPAKAIRRKSILATALLALAGVPVAVATPGDAPAFSTGEPGAAEISLALKLHNPIADMVTVPIENNFEFSSGSRHALTYTLNVQPVIPFHLNQDWLLVTRTIIPFISQQPVVAGERFPPAIKKMK